MKGELYVVLCIVASLTLLGNGCEKERVEDSQKIKEMITHRNLGLAYLEENKLSEAEAEFLQLIRVAPKAALAHANLGLVYLRNGQYIAAEEQVKKALSITPDDPDVRLILAEIYQFSNRDNDALKELETSLQHDPRHVKTRYKMARLYARFGDIRTRLRGMEEHLNKLVEFMPANIVPRLQLIEVLLRNGKAEHALMHLEEIRRQVPDFPHEADMFYDKAISYLQDSKVQPALAPALAVHNLLKLTSLYRAGILQLKGPGGSFIGFPILTFNRQISRKIHAENTPLTSIRFVDVTSSVGLNRVLGKGQTFATLSDLSSNLALGDYDGDGDPDLFFASWTPTQTESANFLFRNDGGRFVEISTKAGINHAGKTVAAIFADYDNDGKPDLYLVNTGANVLYQNSGDGKFHDVTKTAGVADPAYGHAVLFVDLDHEGDLDLYVVNATTNRLYRNNLDGTFTEFSEKMGLTAGNAHSQDAAFGDFDDDGDMDIFVVNKDTSNVLLTNLRQGQFRDITAICGLKSDGGSSAVTVGDYNNDGYLDLFVTGGRFHLYRNKGDGTFEQDERSEEMTLALAKVIGLDASFFDFDNDGFIDLLVVGKAMENIEASRGVFLFRNDGTGKFSDASSILPKDLFSGGRAAIADYDGDGDLDIFFAGLDGGVRLLRNEGGNLNHWLKINLVGLTAGSGKVNRDGIGSKLEVKAGDFYQMQVVTSPVSHFGLGYRPKADVVRVVWTNGVPQNRFHPDSDQAIVEKQVLKGSCAFLYTWDGQKYTFVTDILWRSALGMPLGIMGGATAYAFPNSADEYLKIPGNKLKAHDGVYSIQITEELWETAFFDQVKLVVVDHPDTVDIFIDERFLPPPLPPLYIYSVAQQRIPESATDGEGKDLLPQILQNDDKYVANLTPTQYQGIMEMHDLVLDLGDLAKANRIILYLNGWIFPTDASINVAISQSNKVKVVPPTLQVLDGNGEWRTAIENLGFPMGKNKVVVADLSDKFMTTDYRVRIRTNMQIYWNHVFFSTDTSRIPLRQTILQPKSANIHYRGFSKLYRESRYGPHWFDYSEVTEKSQWRDLVGHYTRYGEVTSLLLESDDKYVIMNAGDEVTVEFDANSVPQLEPGWSRDYLIYSDGWIKDGDLNTAFSKTVSPLPFHGMTSYPYGNEQTYPVDEEHEQYIRQYNTREVTQDAFRNQLLER